MKFKDIIEGLQILAKYEKEGLETFTVGADYRVFWACYAKVEDYEKSLTDSRITPEDAARLKELGWFIASKENNAWTAFV